MAFHKQVNILGSYGGTREDLASVLRLLQQKKIKPIINAPYSLENAKEAFTRLQTHAIYGKMHVKI